MWGLDWDGATAVDGAYINTSDTLASVASWAALLAHAGNCFWQDTAANKVWLKVLPLKMGNSWRFWASGFA